MTTLLDSALAFEAIGCSVVPARPDGSKAPIGAWKVSQVVRSGAAAIAAQMPSFDGFGIVCGDVSGGLELVELEGRAATDGAYAQLAQLADASGLGELWARVTNGYLELTPAGGMHLLYRIADAPVPGNLKLARDADGLVLAETRGEGGFVIVAPSAGRTHPNGSAWTLLRGGPDSIAVISGDERDALHLLFRTLDKTPEPVADPFRPRNGSANRPAGGTIDETLTPGDDYNQRASWAEILEPHGWARVYTAGAVTYWRRPGKAQGISATTGRNDGDNLYVFSSSTPFDQEKPYSKFGALATLEHGGDFSACAKWLRSQNYGGTDVPAVQPHDLIAHHQEGTSWLESSAGSPATPAGSTTAATSAPASVAAPPSDSPEAEQADLTAIAYHRALAGEMLNQRARREAKRLLDDEDNAKDFRVPPWRPTLVEELQIPEQPVAYTVEAMLPTGGNVLLTAQFKAGKTTLVNELTRALADGEPFLGRFEVNPSERRIALFNYEVGEEQYRRWLRDVGIQHPERVVVLHLRGYRLPITTPRVEDWVVRWLEEREVGVWAVDPFARAFVGCGTSENDNSEVGRFLDTLDVIKARAGVTDLILPTHTGRATFDEGQERARGATRLDDWADVRWMLNKDDADDRYLSATGRDVDVLEEKLVYEEGARRLTLGGGDRAWEKRKRVTEAVLSVITGQPGIGSRDLRTAVRDIVKSTSGEAVDAAAHYLEGRRDIRVEKGKVGTPSRHYPSGDMSGLL